MAEKISYSLEGALNISSVVGAILQTDRERIRIDPIEDWRIWRNGQLAATCFTAEACVTWLKERSYPLEQGWLSELPLYVAGEGSFVEIEDDRFEREE